jgi:hypothetical protein
LDHVLLKSIEKINIIERMSQEKVDKMSPEEVDKMIESYMPEVITLVQWLNARKKELTSLSYIFDMVEKECKERNASEK